MKDKKLRLRFEKLLNLLGIHEVNDWKDELLEQVGTSAFCLIGNGVIRKIKERLEKLEKDSEELTKKLLDKNDIVKCDKCKCLIYKKDAEKGEDRIENSYLVKGGWFDGMKFNKQSTIVTPYYCQRCKPKVKK